MSLDAIRAAFDKALATIDPSLPTQHGDETFNPPKEPYQRAHLLAGTPDTPTMGDGMYIENGFYQVMLCYPRGQGEGDILRRGDLIRSHFKRGLTLQQAGVTVTVTATSTGPSIIDGDRNCRAVRIFWFSHIGD